MNPNKLDDPSAGVLPTSEQLAKMGDVMGDYGFGVTATARALYIKPRKEEAEEGAGGSEDGASEGGSGKKRRRDAELPTLGGAVIETSNETAL
jgi:hypothetical protein